MLLKKKNQDCYVCRVLLFFLPHHPKKLFTDLKSHAEELSSL